MRAKLSPGDMLIFTLEGNREVAVLTERFDMHAKPEKPADYVSTHYPTWCWHLVFTPDKHKPWGYSRDYGMSEVNLINSISAGSIKHIPREQCL